MLVTDGKIASATVLVMRQQGLIAAETVVDAAVEVETAKAVKDVAAAVVEQALSLQLESQ